MSHLAYHLTSDFLVCNQCQFGPGPKNCLFEFLASVLMYGALLLFDEEFLHIVSISFTGLVLTEWIMVCLTIETWIWVHAVAILISVACYTATVFIDTGTFSQYLEMHLCLFFPKQNF